MDAEETLALADRGFAELIAGWPSTLRDPLASLDRRVWGAPSSCHEAYPRRFNTLTRLYPAMQIDGLLPCPPSRMQSALVAHACLVMYAYLQDKADDGQVHFTDRD